MKRVSMWCGGWLLLVIAGTLAAADLQLPKPENEGGIPLMDALRKRATGRSFSQKPLSNQMISNLLWAANGINRESGKRTAPSALNRQEIALYVILASGAYRYEAETFLLKQLTTADLTTQVGGAPLTVVFVADLARQGRAYALTDCGFIGQNIYLFSAANGLNCVFRASMNTLIGKHLKLPANHEILYSQSVGYPLE